MTSKLQDVTALLSIGAALAFSPIARAAETNPPDLSGVYQVRPAYAVGAQHTTDGKPVPAQEWVEKELQRIADTEAKGVLVPTNGQMGWPKGFVHASKARFNFLLVQNPDQISWFLEEDSQYLYVPLNVNHPAKITPGFLGDAAGHWEGDDLVIDMIGFNGKSPLGNYPLTTKAHVVMHIHLIEGGKALENIVDIDDPGAYTRPWQAQIIYNRAAPDTRVYESVYAENNRDLPNIDQQKPHEAPK